MTTAAGALRVIVWDGSIRISDHAPSPVPIGNGVAGGPESVRDAWEVDQLANNAWEVDQLANERPTLIRPASYQQRKIP